MSKARGKSRKPRITKKLQATAYHEVGHAVMNWILHRRMTGTTIIPSDDGSTLGCVVKGSMPSFNPELNNDARTRRYAEREILSLFAGEAAEAYFKGRHNWQGSSQDHSCAIDMALWICGGIEEAEAYLKWLYIRPRKMITGRMYWPFVEAVAAALLDHCHLSAKEIHQAIRDKQRLNREGGMAEAKELIASGSVKVIKG